MVAQPYPHQKWKDLPHKRASGSRHCFTTVFYLSLALTPVGAGTPCRPNIHLPETMYVLKEPDTLNFSHPIHGLGLSYYVRAAGLYNHIETENADGNIINDTGHGLGFQLAGGVEIPLNSKWSLTPGIKFNSLDRKTDYEGSPLKLHYQYLSIRIGIVRKF